MNVVARAQLTFQMLTLLQKYLQINDNNNGICNIQRDITYDSPDQYFNQTTHTAEQDPYYLDFVPFAGYRQSSWSHETSSIP